MAIANKGLFGGGSSVDTTSATPVTVTTMVVAEDVRINFEGKMVGWCAATGEMAVANFSGGARRVIGGNVVVPVSLFGSGGGAEGSLAGATVQLSVSNPDTVLVQAVGVTGKTITWNCLGSTVEQV